MGGVIVLRKLALGLVLLTACSGGEAGPDPAADVPAAGDGTTTASGLTITHTTEGTGESPAATDVVLVHYHGTYPDGRVFDSSVERGEPARFSLNRVIPCWTEGVQLMKVGGKAKLVCPPEIAYGRRGAPPSIPPNATLHFEVELLEIQ
jgi:FKBP-type peptidyl-prolyl cis-trans isomerase FkpA